MLTVALLPFVPMYVQCCDDVIKGYFPASPERLLKLAALRLQFLDGDCVAGSTM